MPYWTKRGKGGQQVALSRPRNYPLQVSPAATVSEEMARVARIISQHKDYLDR